MPDKHNANLKDEPSTDSTFQGDPEFDPEAAEVYAEAMRILNHGGIPYCVSGTPATYAYTGLWRETKDFDVFVKVDDLDRAMDLLEESGFETHVEYDHWLAKARKGSHTMDLIFRLNNGQLEVDDAWFEDTRPIQLMGVQTQAPPIEELLASKMYIAVRNRFDGGDVVHLIHSVEGRVDWERVLEMLGDDYELLLWHLLLFDFVYPGHADYLPQDLMRQLFERVCSRWSKPGSPKAFRGTLLDPYTYTVDIEQWGYRDRRDQQTIVNEEGEKV